MHFFDLFWSFFTLNMFYKGCSKSCRRNQWFNCYSLSRATKKNVCTQLIKNHVKVSQIYHFKNIQNYLCDENRQKLIIQSLCNKVSHALTYLIFSSDNSNRNKTSFLFCTQGSLHSCHNFTWSLLQGSHSHIHSQD